MASILPVRLDSKEAPKVRGSSGRQKEIISAETFCQDESEMLDHSAKLFKQL